MPKFTNIGVEAVVANLSGFMRDTNMINKQVQGVSKDLQKMAQASLRGQGAAIKTAQQLSDKYSLIAKNAREMATVMASKGLLETAGKLTEQARSAENLARQYQKVAKEAKGVTKESSKLRKISDFIKESWAEIGAAGAIVVAGFQGMKKVFDLGKEGAAVIQTAESFDLLLKKVGVTTDLLKELRTVSRGTIDDQTLMASTSLLLAGAGEELALAMANATPQILEIAKAANKLNPALGSTAFLYESLSRGIKRNSPLIIDNTGLVIKIGAANKKYADQLGITVDEMTAEQRSLALLNDTLRAGATLIEQAGGNTVSATDAYSEMEATLKNLADTMKANLAPAITRVAKAANVLLTQEKKITDVTADHLKEVFAIAKSYKIYETELRRVAELTGRQVLTQAEFNAAMIAGGAAADIAERSLVLLSEGLFDGTQMEQEFSEEARFVDSALRGVATGAQAAVEPIEELTEATEDAVEPASALANAYAAIDKNLAATVTGIRENIAFLAAGGGELVAAAAAVEKAFIDEDIGAGVADNLLQEVGLASLALQEDIGLITMSEAQKTAIEDYGSTWGTVREDIDLAGAAIESLPQEVFLDIAMGRAETMLEGIEGLETLTLPSPTEVQDEAVADYGAKWEHVAGQIQATQAGINALPAKVVKEVAYDIKLNIEIALRGLPEFQHGGQFEVGGRPGIDTNLVAFRASRKEVVTVTPAGFPAPSTTTTDNRAVNIGNVNNNNRIEDYAFDQAMRRWLGD